MEYTLDQKRKILQLKKLGIGLLFECEICHKKFEGSYFCEYGDDGDSGILCNECSQYEPTQEDLKDHLIEIYHTWK